MKETDPLEDHLNTIAKNLTDKLLKTLNEQNLTKEARQYILMKLVLNISELPEMKTVTDDWKNKSVPFKSKDK
jgi:hypothetical protein